MSDNSRIPLSLVRASSTTQVPACNGQVILRPDTGVVEADLDSVRIRLTGVEGVDELPETPLDRVYLCNGQFWAHNGTGWVRLAGKTVSILHPSTDKVKIKAADGDFQMLHIHEDTEIIPPADIDEYGREIQVEVTNSRFFSFTIDREEFGGVRQVSAIDTDAWLVIFHKGYANVVRWRVEPLRPNTFLAT